MSSNHDPASGPGSNHPFEIARRGYDRAQVDEFVTDARRQVSDLENRLATALGEAEELRSELTAARQETARPVHETVSERIAQILGLADEEARVQRARAAEEISKLRSQAQHQAAIDRDEAGREAEEMLTAARELAQEAIASAQAEAEATLGTARTAAERATAEVRERTEMTLARANAQAGQVLAEATARADAVHDGAERRLAQLTEGHAEVMRRLTEIRDLATDLVARDTARGPLAEEVASTAAALAATAGQASAAAEPHGTGGQASGGDPGPGEDRKQD